MAFCKTLDFIRKTSVIFPSKFCVILRDLFWYQFAQIAKTEPLLSKIKCDFVSSNKGLGTHKHIKLKHFYKHD